MDGENYDLGPDQRLAALAAQQFGVFDLRDARDCGLGPGAIDRRVASRRWVRIHRGVYALGHAELRVEGRRLAAVRACGRDAALSHADAAAAWDLMTPRGARFNVTVPACARRDPDRQRIRVHALSLTPGEVTVLGALRITTVARVLLDLAADTTPRRIEDLISAADLRGIYDGRAVEAVLAAHPTRRGTARLRALIDRLEGAGVPRTRSEMETRFRVSATTNASRRPRSTPSSTATRSTSTGPRRA